MLRQVLKLFSGVSLSKFLQFIYFFSAATYCSKEEFGSYVFLLTLNLICVYPVLEWGTELLINQHTAQKDRAFFSNALCWKLLVFPFLFLAITTYAVYDEGFTWSLAILAVVLILFRSLEQSSYAYFRGRGHVEYEALHLTLSRSLSLGLLIPALWMGALDAFYIFLFQILGSSISLLWVHHRFKTFGSIDPPDKEGLRRLIQEGFPLALTALSWIVYFKIDILMIGNLLDRTQSGYYEVAYKILELSFLIPNVIMSVYFRELVLKQGTAEVVRTFWKGALFLLVPSLAVLLMSQLIVPHVVDLFLRPDQKIGASVFSILAWSIPGWSRGHLTTQLLVVQGRRITYLAIMLSGALINIFLNF
ncbi:MAG: oligosaccharide flippase family protein, partial [SAR324 cluster bacterium]|nr:oligosaccharide flippase family protein [SAR324 cluster bacterium]